jgi:hypothetical protein
MQCRSRRATAVQRATAVHHTCVWFYLVVCCEQSPIPNLRPSVRLHFRLTVKSTSHVDTRSTLDCLSRTAPTSIPLPTTFMQESCTTASCTPIHVHGSPHRHPMQPNMPPQGGASPVCLAGRLSGRRTQAAEESQLAQTHKQALPV